MKTKIMLLMALLLVGIAANAQVAQFKALYLYNFAKNISWPGNDNSDFIVTVIGDNDVAAEMEKIATTKKVGMRKLVVNKAATPANLPNSHIVFLGESKMSQMPTLISSQEGKNVLIVSGKNGQCPKGAAISFVSASGKLNYEISDNNIKKAGLTCAKKILQLGIEVE